VEQKASPSAKVAIKGLAGDLNFNFIANVLWYIKYALYYGNKDRDFVSSSE